MSNWKPAMAAFALLAIILALDAFWLFRIGLPRHPPAAQPTPLQNRASLQDREAYEGAIESAESQNWERRRVVDTAIVIPGIAAFCAGVFLLIRRLE